MPVPLLPVGVRLSVSLLLPVGVGLSVGPWLLSIGSWLPVRLLSVGLLTVWVRLLPIGLLRWIGHDLPE